MGMMGCGDGCGDDGVWVHAKKEKSYCSVSEIGPPNLDGRMDIRTDKHFRVTGRFLLSNMAPN